MLQYSSPKLPRIPKVRSAKSLIPIFASLISRCTFTKSTTNHFGGVLLRLQREKTALHRMHPLSEATAYTAVLEVIPFIDSPLF
jgi:hypothetical protein